MGIAGVHTWFYQGKRGHVILLHIVSESEITNCQLLWQFLSYSVQLQTVETHYLDLKHMKGLVASIEHTHINAVQSEWKIVPPPSKQPNADVYFSELLCK